VLEQLTSPLGIGAAIVVVLVVLIVIRKIFSFIFVVLALVLGGWAAARALDWDVPFVLPGSAIETLAMTGDKSAPEPMAESEAVTTRSLAPRSAPTAAADSAGGATAAAEAAADAVRTAQIRYNAPATMQLNMPINLRLAIDASGMEDLESVLEDLPGEIRSGEAELTSQVTATLTGTGFDIRPLKPARQVLTEERPSTWQWEVTPRVEGRHTLVLEVFAHPGGGDAAASVREFRDEITVEVTPLSKVLHFAQTADPLVGVGGGAVSLALALFGLFRRRKKRRP
jgi:hypothetical protein